MEEEEEVSAPSLRRRCDTIKWQTLCGGGDIGELLRVEWERIMAAINLLLFFFFPFCVGTAAPSVFVS